MPSDNGLGLFLTALPAHPAIHSCGATRRGDRVLFSGLEILANDVRCTHGATVGRVDREDLFYLQSRGLPRHEAERLIVRGFFQEILDRIELEPVREAVTAALEARIPQA
jgi:SUF system FeS cluster assembly, SufBD